MTGAVDEQRGNPGELALTDYYIVPMGRERGGLLDLLGLPANPSARQLGDAKASYGTELQNAAVLLKRAAKAQHEAGELTDEERKARFAEATAEENDKLQYYNELVGKYDAEQAQTREQRGQGSQFDDHEPWLTLGFDLAVNEAWAPILARRSLPAFGPDTLSAIERRCANLLRASHELGERSAADRSAGAGVGEPRADVTPPAIQLPAGPKPPAGADREEIEQLYRQHRREVKRRWIERRREFIASVVAGDRTREEAGALQVSEWKRVWKPRFDEIARKMGTEASTVPPVRRERKTPPSGRRPSNGATLGDIRWRAAGLGDGGDRLPSSSFVPESPASLLQIAVLTEERDLLGLVCADLLWTQVGRTGRYLWAADLGARADELSSNAPPLAPGRNSKHALPFPHETFGQPYTPAVMRLEQKGIEDVADGPDRSQQETHGLSLGSLLDKLLGAQRSAAGSDTPPRPGGQPPGLGGDGEEGLGSGKAREMMDFMRFMKAAAQLLGKDDD